MGNKKVLRKFYDARAKSEQEKHLSYVHPDCTFQIIGTDKLGEFTKRWIGKEEIEKAATMLFAAWDLSQLKIVTQHHSKDTIYVHRRGDVIFIPDGSRIEDTQVVDKLTFKDDLIVEYLQFVDTFAVNEFMTKKNSKKKATK